MMSLYPPNYQLPTADLKPAVPLPAGKPRDPMRIFSMAIFISFPLASIILGLNWKRLGKPDWVVPTIMTALGIVIVLIAGLVALVSVGNLTLPKFGVISFLGGLNICFPLVVAYLQKPAYEKWDIYHDVSAMLTHTYDFTKPFLSGLIGVVAVMGIGVGVYWYQFIPAKADGDAFTVEYARGKWESQNPDTIAWCADMPNGCAIHLVSKANNGTDIIFIEMTLDSSWTVEAAEQADWNNYLSSHPGHTFDRRDPITIHGHTGLVRESLAPADEYPNRYELDVYLMDGSSLLIVSAYTEDRATMNRDRNKIMDVINTVEFR
jgi:hypothetical protein